MRQPALPDIDCASRPANYCPVTGWIERSMHVHATPSTIGLPGWRPDGRDRRLPTNKFVAEHEVSAVVFDYYGTLADFSFWARERLFDDLARQVGANLLPGEAYRHWREEIISDSDVRLGGLQRPPLDGPTPSFVGFRETWLERFQHLFRLWGVNAPASDQRPMEMPRECLELIEGR